MPRIIAYPWTDSAFSTAPLSTTSTLTLTKADTSTETYAFSTTNQHGVTQLATFNTNLAFLTGASYSPTTRRVTLSGPVAFKPTFASNLGLWYGYTQGPYGSYATSWVADKEPACVQELTFVQVEPAQTWDQTELKEYEAGRARPVVWGNHMIHRVICAAHRDAIWPFTTGFVTTGKVRIVTDGEVTPLSATAPDGYLDGWVVASTDLEVDGDVDEWVTFTLWLAVARVY